MQNAAILLTCIKLPSVFKTFVLSIFEWPLKTGFTVGPEYEKNYRKIVIFFLTHQFKHVFWSHCDDPFEYQQHMLWLHLPVSADVMDITFFVLIKESIKSKENF